MNVIKSIIKFLLLAILCLGIVFVMKLRYDLPDALLVGPAPVVTVAPTPVQSVVDSPAATPIPTPEPTPEPEPEYFTISMVGDCTLWSSKNFEQSNVGFPLVVKEDYAYPFSNTIDYFKDDEFTLANLENNFSEGKLYSAQMFSFLAPPSYANILVEGSVEFVTTANNHMMDFNETGAQRTYEALEAIGMPYGVEGQAQIVETPNGIKLGIYTAGNDMRPDFKLDQAVNAVKQLKEDGADYIICMFHWGQELYYTPNQNQTKLAYACADAGADLIYGSHPHCLQPIEKYNDTLICYSLGNWSFGGSTRPSDPDTAIVQVTLKRDIDGTVSTDGFKAIPCCVSSNLNGAAKMSDNYNNYCPTPYEEGSEQYERVISKLNGTFQPAKEGADYTNYYASWG